MPNLEKLGGSLDYDTGMDMIKAGGSLTPSQTIDLAAQNLRAVSVLWAVFVSTAF